MLTKTIQGMGASEGIAVGPVFRYEVHRLVVDRRQVDDVKHEATRLDAALAQARQELQRLSAQAQADIGADEAAIFEAHAMFLDDPELLERVHTTIETLQMNAEYAWQEGTEHYIAALRAIGDEYLSARAADVEDVAQRVQRILQGGGTQSITLTEPVVIVANDLTPSDTVTLEKTKVLAFCTATGGPTSHVAILAKALGIPAVVGLGEEANQLATTAQVIVDGTSGEVLIGPDEATIAGYRQRAGSLSQKRQGALKSTGQPAVTLDGVRVEVVANIGSPADAIEALQYGAEGIGLLRTEFLFLERETGPDEDEQTAVYRAIFQIMGRRPVVVRTLDIGGDKPASYLSTISEMNPFLGVRGARLSLTHTDVFQAQLRALLRAGAGHNLKIMFPMIATLEEVYAVQEQVEQARAMLEASGMDYAQKVEIGIMVEVPSAALMADVLAKTVDFFSIGTNDLAQYTLAADRTNAGVSKLADALHPSVLRLIRVVIEAAHAQGKWVGLCGELAGNPLATPVLLGLGLDEFSMTPKAIPVVKQTIRHFSASEVRNIAEHALALSSATEVRAYLESVAL
ncbi:MAG TPA: phosphoenolpyruvate--protein phosphotransferase [Ktedonobacteraceae bacterium]|nr:phosphoenolpyruvate--protein phosphotransferase [Ktedonobacteraceae bacterium]